MAKECSVPNGKFISQPFLRLRDYHAREGAKTVRDKGQRRPEQNFVYKRTTVLVNATSVCEHKTKSVNILARSEKGFIL